MLTRVLVRALRGFSRSLDAAGRALDGAPYVEQLIPSTRVLKYRGKLPTIEASFVAPCATVCGDVVIGKGSSVWYGAVVRGDVNSITIGENSCIGDRSVVHVTGMGGEAPTRIGSRVSVGASCIVHGATLEDECMVGDGAKILDRSVVKKHAMVAPGAVLTSKTVPSGELWAGCPAVKVRDLTADEVASLSDAAMDTAELAHLHMEETSKTWEEVEADRIDLDDRTRRDPRYFQPQTHEAIAEQEGLVEGRPAPGRIFNNVLRYDEEAALRERVLEDVLELAEFDLTPEQAAQFSERDLALREDALDVRYEDAMNQLADMDPAMREEILAQAAPSVRARLQAALAESEAA